MGYLFIAYWFLLPSCVMLHIFIIISVYVYSFTVCCFIADAANDVMACNFPWDQYSFQYSVLCSVLILDRFILFN